MSPGLSSRWVLFSTWPLTSTWRWLTSCGPRRSGHSCSETGAVEPIKVGDEQFMLPFRACLRTSLRRRPMCGVDRMMRRLTSIDVVAIPGEGRGRQASPLGLVAAAAPAALGMSWRSSAYAAGPASPAAERHATTTTQRPTPQLVAAWQGPWSRTTSPGSRTALTAT